MKKYKTQICIVSGQSVQNVTPVMDQNIRPDNVILCASDSMKNNAEILQQFFQQKNINTEIFPLGNAYNFIELKDRFLELADKIKGQDIAVNLTGGTKLMTIAAQEVFSGDAALFYVIPNANSIMMISPEEDRLYNIQNEISLKDYFAIHGYKISSSRANLNIAKETDELFTALMQNENIHKYGEAMGTLNYAASMAEKNKKLTVDNLNRIPEKLLSLFSTHGSVSYFDDTTIRFKDTYSRSFCNGIWLEEYIFMQLAEINKNVKLQDFAVSVKIENQHGVKNELDAAFLYKNRLYTIECKTSRLDNKNAEVVYKMDSLRNLAGLTAKTLLVSYRSLNKFDKQRADDLGIAVFTQNEITPNAFCSRVVKLINK